MNIATQGGKLILKDSKLAKNCGCCEQGGEWYCCRELPPTCGGADYVKSASVVVTTGADYVKVEQSVNRGPECASRWSAKAVSITPSSHYAGTFQLFRSSDTQWRYDYAPDAAGCVASILLAVTNRAGVLGYSFAWRLELIHHAYLWQKNAPTLPSEIQTLSQMQCSPPTRPTLQGCYPSPVEWYEKTTATTNLNTTSSFGPVSGWEGGVTLTPDGLAPLCPPSQSMAYSGGLAALGLVATNDSNTGSGTPIDVVSESGSLAYTMQLEIQTS
jgi:hypothetical protein